MRKRLSEFKERQAKQAGAGLRREITEGFKYDKKKIKHLQKMLHNVNVALGTLGAALGEFSRVKGPSISPDGLLGGLGYIMPIKGVKETLTNSVHTLSEVADTLADELTNPHWQAKEDKETKKVIKEKEEVEEETQKVLDPDISEEDEEESPEEETEDEKAKEEEKTEEEEGKPEGTDQKEPENKPEDEEVKPEDVVTSKELVASGINPTEILSKAVKQALVRFSSAGKI